MIRHDLIGHELRVIEATNDALVGIKGLIVKETMHTLRVRTDRGEKVLLKSQVTIEVAQHHIEGARLEQRPEQRTKARIRRWQRRKPSKTTSPP